MSSPTSPSWPSALAQAQRLASQGRFDDCLTACQWILDSYADDPEAHKVWQGEFSRKLSVQIQEVARRKLRMINDARRIEDLCIPPNNRLEALKGSRKGQWSICINDQWRVCFVWNDGHAGPVEIYGYH